MAVFLADEQADGGVPDVDGDDLLALARHVLGEEEVPPDMELAVLLVDRDTMTAMNREHMGGTGPTDVLAFPIDMPGDSPPVGPAVLGDVVLCPAVAREQAASLGRRVQDELRMLTVHGILHLLGMDHAEPDEKQLMFGRTDELLDSFGGVDRGAST